MTCLPLGVSVSCIFGPGVVYVMVSGFVVWVVLVPMERVPMVSMSFSRCMVVVFFVWLSTSVITLVVVLGVFPVIQLMNWVIGLVLFSVVYTVFPVMLIVVVVFPGLCVSMVMLCVLWGSRAFLVPWGMVAFQWTGWLISTGCWVVGIKRVISLFSALL